MWLQVKARNALTIIQERSWLQKMPDHIEGYDHFTKLISLSETAMMVPLKGSLEVLKWLI